MHRLQNKRYIFCKFGNNPEFCAPGLRGYLPGNGAYPQQKSPGCETTGGSDWGKKGVVREALIKSGAQIAPQIFRQIVR